MLRRFSPLAGCVVLACALCVATFALAQPGDPALAEKLFREARELVTAGKAAEACPKFAGSYDLEPANGTLMNLADCEERVGKLAQSATHWRKLADALAGSTDPRLAHARQRLQAVDRKLPRLTLRLAPAAPAGTKVILDGAELAPSSLARAEPLDPGTHAVAVQAPGRDERTYSVTLRERERKDLAVEPGQPPAAAASRGAAHRLPIRSATLRAPRGACRELT